MNIYQYSFLTILIKSFVLSLTSCNSFPSLNCISDVRFKLENDVKVDVNYIP